MSKTILITGSTDGIGKLVAIKLAKEGHKILVHGRNSEKLNSTISELQKITDFTNIEGFLADFSDLESVKEMTNQIKKNISKIDILINNAGIFNSPNQQNKDGFDIRFVVNYLAPYSLTEELIPLMLKVNDARIINLSSAAQSSLSYDLLFGKETRSDKESYAQSKLALTMWSFHLSKLLKDISVIALNPGSLLDTKMAKEAFGQIWSPAEKGVDIIYNLSVSDEFKGVTGKYFDNDQGGFNQAHSDAYDESKITELIKTTEVILAKK